MIYAQKTKKITLAPSASDIIELDNQSTPFEDPTIWVYSAEAGDYDMIPLFNGQPLVAQAINSVTDVMPQKILILGVFPKNAPVAGQVLGVIPGVQVTNNGTDPLVLTVAIAARVMGES
jgi:hypothetical protein